MGFKDTIKKLDIFGKPKGLTIEGEETHKTYMGVVCAFTFLFSLIFAGIYFLLQWVNRYDNPVVKVKGTYAENAPKLNLTELDFIFSITGYIGENVVKPTELGRIVNVSISKGARTTNTTENSVTTSYVSAPAVPCSEDHFLVREENLIAEPQFADLTLSVCRNPEEDIMLEGQSAEVSSKKFVRISVGPCTQNCRADAQSLINDKGLRITFGFNQASVDETNFDYPYKHIYQTNLEFDCYDTRQYKRKYFMVKTNVMTEQGWFTVTNRTNSVLNFETEFVEDRKRNSDEDYLVMEFYASHNGLNVTRSYTTLSDTLSLIGGIATSLTTGIGIIYGIYNGLSLKIHLINRTILKSANGKGVKLYAYHLPKIFLCKASNALGICGGCFSEHTKLKMTLFFSGNLRVYQYLDINNIVQNIRDIKLFKKIFLNSEQEYLLNKIEQDTLLMEGATDYGEIMDGISDSEDEELVREDRLMKKQTMELGRKARKKRRETMTHQDVERIKKIFKLFFNNANDPERLKDSIDIRLNNFLDEYILDVLDIYKKEIEEATEGRIKFDYESLFDLKEYGKFVDRRKLLIERYKANLLTKNILNRNNIVKGVLNAALKIKQKLKNLRSRKKALKGINKKAELEMQAVGIRSEKEGLEDKKKPSVSVVFKEDLKDGEKEDKKLNDEERKK